MIGCRGATFVLSWAATAGGVVAQRAEMTALTPFVARQALTPEHAEPRGWIASTDYLTFDTIRAAEPTKAFFRVDAKSGEREPLFDHAAARTALAALQGVEAATLDAALADPDAYHFDQTYAGFALRVGGDLLWFDANAGRATRLTAQPGDEVGEQISPDGKSVGFVNDYDLWVVGVDGESPRRLTTHGSSELLFGRLDWVYQEELYGRGDFQGYWWSPDSSHIALLRLDESPVREFTLVRDLPAEAEVEVANYPKAGAPNPIASIGVVDVRDGTLRWFDLSRFGETETLIVRVTWHPDSTEVFFQVQNREQTWLEMLAGDVASGEVRPVFREESDCWIDSGPLPIWLGDGAEFLWQSERDGRQHLYRYRRSGELVGRVTSGEFDVEKVVAVDEAAAQVWFMTDRTHPTEMHLWRIGLDGSDAQQVSELSGWHDVDVSPDRAHYLDEYSALEYRLARSVHSIDGERVRTIVESDMNALAPFGLRAPEFHRVPARDGFAMEAILIKPADYENGKRYPVLCHTYSGPHAPRALNRWRARDYLWHQLIAQHGYLVWICDNRSASGKGRKVHKACYRNFGVTETRDLEDGVRWLVDQGLADPDRVGIWGWSYGGYQTLYCLTHSKVWKCGIAVNPVTDWRFYDTIYTERYMGRPQDNPDGYARASVLEVAGDLRGDLLLVHATMDDNVHIQNSHAFVHALQQAGKQFRFMPYPRVRHGIGDLRQQVHLFTMMRDFVLEKL